MMLRKLFAFVSGNCAEDNQDAQTNHELLTGGLLFGNLLKVQASADLFMDSFALFNLSLSHRVFPVPQAGWGLRS